MSQTTDTLFLDRHSRLNTSVSTFLRRLHNKAATFYSSSIVELLAQVETATTASHLTTAINRVQKRLWKLPAKEQVAFRNTLIIILSTHTLQNKQPALRVEAAGWLRLFVQAGFVATPQDVFVTLVIAATRITPVNNTAIKEQQAYLRMIFDCFWPFRYPYPAYTWRVFPTNTVFFPLASLITTADESTQDILISIFGELPSLNDVEIATCVLPVALQWANHSDPERRRRITSILARLDNPIAQETLVCLLSDTDPDVREMAKSASDFLRQA